MIALTQEKREELANYARSRLASHVVHGGCSDEEDVFKIALAALTAQPDCWSIVDRVFSTKEEALAPGFIGEPEPLFACPPVPGIKFPEKLPCDVSVSPSAVFRKGVNTQTLLNCLIRKSSDLNGLGE